ncbi:peptidoglycan-associated lipoprotein [Candidatus Photodesmus katoptron]|uniref:OmpA family protein n=1 Tax=Candidatus Photodesmus anomalopis TaxID=28176 RepID=UPI0004D70573|nr:OmpA family protein [Candidatus Photodesmus katoptron]KEY90820.1 peptidoglycan-associated lipoprotein [Candidatus Photodesmus katoptron]
MYVNSITISMIIWIFFCSGCSSLFNLANNKPEKNILFKSLKYESDDFLKETNELQLNWEMNKLHLDMLIQKGAKWCFPAIVTQAVITQDRIAHELKDSLLIDAANGILIQHNRLNQLESRLNYVISKTSCQPPLQQDTFNQKITVIKKISNILNSDNQFAHDSSEINPKYMRKLAEAANLLLIHNYLNLSITGHSDSTGNKKYNEQLSMMRATQVKRYLCIFGLEPERIITHSLGESVPLFKGNSPEINLANRRVSIEIIPDWKDAFSMLKKDDYELK